MQYLRPIDAKEELAMMFEKRVASARFALAFFAALALTASAHAAQHGANGSSPEFRQMDTNHDGYISSAEAKKQSDFDKALGEADDNHDGRLDATEFVKAESVYARMRAGQYINDSVITAKVKAALLKDERLSGLGVTVETYKGTVLLSGFVSNEQLARHAAEIASRVRGVTAVRNSLLVKS
jgi:hyperosmotically inducible protein